MAKNSKLISKSDTAAFAALFGLVPIFLTIVTIGWKNILTNVIIIPDYLYAQIIVQYIIAFFVALVGIFLARGVAAERRKLKNKIELGPTTTWIAYFFVLVVISALGTITTVFKATQETTIIQEVIQSTEHNIRTLKTAAINNIKAPAYDEAVKAVQEDRKKVDNLFLKLTGDLNDLVEEQKAELAILASDADIAYKDFVREARNPQRPGIGPAARQNFDKLQKIVPIEPLSGGMNGLTDQVIAAYDEKFKDAKNKKFDINSATCVLKDSTLLALKDIKQKVSSIIEFNDVICGRANDKLADVKNRIQAEFVRREPRLADDEKSKLDFKKGLIEQFDKELGKLDLNYKDINKISKDTTGPILKASWSKYAELRDHARDFMDPAVLDNLPDNIDDDTIDHLGQITHTIDILIQRWDKIQTYFIVFFGLVFDIILVAFFARTISSLEDRDDDDPYGFASASPSSVKNLFNG